MKLTELFTANESERAVSPVIGVILMVAITVILAAVIGTFVLGLGDQVQTTSPNAQWEWSDETSGVHLTHEGGDTVDPARLGVTDSDNSANTYCEEGDWGSGGVSEITAGTTCEITSGDVDSDDELTLVWTAEGGGNSATLSSYTVP